MSLTGAFLAHELRTQARSLRFRVLAVLFVALGSFPAGLIFALRGNLRSVIGSATYAAEAMGFLPLMAGVLAFLVSADGISRERDAGTWTTLTLAGVSSAGYLLRRWLALQVMLLPLTAIPLGVSAGLAAAAGLPVEPAPFLGRWLLGVAPVAVAFSTLGLGLGTLGGGGVQTFVLAGAALWGLPALADLLLFRVRARFASPLGWLDIRSWADGIRRLQMTFEPDQRWGPAFPQPTSEAGYAFGVAGEQYLAGALPTLLLAALALGLAGLYLRRTRPDLAPWRIRRDHPLRTYLSLVARWREQAVPDPAPAVPERVTMAMALLVAAAVLGLLLARGHHYTDLARLRYQTETSGEPDPTPTGVIPGRWRLEGRLGPGDGVAVRVTGELLNQGSEAVRQLSFQLNPELRVESATASRGRLTLQHRWDRLTARLDTPILPGERREIRFRVAGRPASYYFTLAWARSFDGIENNFLQAFQWHEQARFARDFSDFGQSYRIPALSPLRVDLAAADLVPLPRYLSWKTVKHAVPQETFFPPADVEISLAAEPGLFLADSCGGVAGPDGRLRSRCRQPLGELRVVGGPHRELPPEGTEGTDAAGWGATVAVLPGHARQAKLHLGILARGARMIQEAWPGLDGFERPVILEWPSPRVHDLHGARLLGFSWSPDRNPFSVTGSLIFLPEADLISSRVFEPEGLAALAVSARLARQRPAVPEDAFFFSQLFHHLALLRLGLGPEAGAVVGPVRTGMEKSLRTPPPEPWEPYWSSRFPALVAALESRMGAEALRRALDEFLGSGSRGGPRPGTRGELFATLARHGGPPVARMIDDFLVKGALPEPVLLDVGFQRTAGGWRATGRVENRGDGEAVCKLVLTTDLSPVETEVRVEGGRSVPFALTSPQRPQGVFLDPDRECHRLVRMMGSPDRAYFQGETR